MIGIDVGAVQPAHRAASALTTLGKERTRGSSCLIGHLRLRLCLHEAWRRRGQAARIDPLEGRVIRHAPALGAIATLPVGVILPCLYAVSVTSIGLPPAHEMTFPSALAAAIHMLAIAPLADPKRRLAIPT